MTTPRLAILCPYILNVTLTRSLLSLLLDQFCRIVIFFLNVRKRTRGVEIFLPVTWYLYSHGNLFIFISSAHVLCAAISCPAIIERSRLPPRRLHGLLVNNRGTSCGVLSPAKAPSLSNKINRDDHGVRWYRGEIKRPGSNSESGIYMGATRIGSLRHGVSVLEAGFLVGQIPTRVHFAEESPMFLTSLTNAGRCSV